MERLTRSEQSRETSRVCGWSAMETGRDSHRQHSSELVEAPGRLLKNFRHIFLRSFSSRNEAPQKCYLSRANFTLHTTLSSPVCSMHVVNNSPRHRCREN